MDSSSSDDEDYPEEFWNNWCPNTSNCLSEDQYKSSSNRIPQSRETLSDFSRTAAVISSIEDSRFGNWIPPLNFLKYLGKDGQSLIPKTTQKQLVKYRASLNTSENYEDTQKGQETSGNQLKTVTSTNAWKKELNLDWGERIELHDVAKTSDRELFWGIVDLGIFGKIQLRVNEYGYICCSAGGKVSKVGSSENTYISINNPEILRKMLTISSDQWASLCETIKETKAVLNFNAFEECDLQKRNSLEKLWFFICKRRHLLPRQCMLLKFGGVVKCMRKLEITPKLLVQDIRIWKDDCSTMEVEKMLRVKPTLLNTRSKDLLLMGLYLRRFPKSHRLEFCHAASVVSPAQEESVGRSLPSLPVQPLEQMIDKYIKSVKPFVNSSELEKTKELAKRFCEDENIGQKLQMLLEERGKCMENWLADWWLQVAYLEYRSPVPIYSSPALVWPKIEFTSKEDQLMYAAHIIKVALEFNKLIERKKIPQDKLGGHLLCMNQYNKIFGTCRIPKVPRDELLFQDSKNPSSNIIVMYNNHLFSIPAFENSQREPLSPSHFYSMLLDVVAKGDGQPGIPVGVLTSEHRDNWAKSYEELKRDGRNKRILEEYVEKALFVVCVDKAAPTEGNRSTYDTRCSKLLLHGFGSRGNAGNRWYDKTIQFVVGADADGVGIVYEHSPAEGGPIAVLTDFINSSINNGEKLEALSVYPKPEKLELSVSDLVKENIVSAGEAFSRLSDDLDVCGWHFTDFGKDELKRLKVSPDSFIQIAIQLAFYKTHARPAAQYESGSLRKFIYGRTDTIRSCSEEVVSFCEAISNPEATPVEVSRALRRAIDSHKMYAREVLEGRGVDRHLLGLKILARLNNMEDPKLFSDSAFQRSTHFQLSTSNVATKCDAFMVYGPLVQDGYACCYNPRDESINFGTSAWSSCKTTSLDTFNKNLREALISMRLCFVESLKTSKL